MWASVCVCGGAGGSRACTWAFVWVGGCVGGWVGVSVGGWVGIHVGGWASIWEGEGGGGN